MIASQALQSLADVLVDYNFTSYAHTCKCILDFRLEIMPLAICSSCLKRARINAVEVSRHEMCDEKPKLGAKISWREGGVECERERRTLHMVFEQEGAR